MPVLSEPHPLKAWQKRGCKFGGEPKIRPRNRLFLNGDLEYLTSGKNVL